MQSYFKSKRLPYLLLLPTFVILIVFLFYPALETFRLSLYKVHPYGIRKIFAGLYNFKKLLASADYLHSFRISFMFSLTVVAVGLFLSLMIAVLLNQKLRGQKIYRSLLIWPYALSPAIAGALFRFLFNPVNGYMLHLPEVVLGIEPAWLTSGPLAIVIITMAATWKNLGYNIIFYLTGLQNVQRESLDAAKMDGCSPMRYLFQILIPLSANTIGALVVIEFIYIWNQYLWPLMATNSKHMRVVQIGVKMLIQTESINNWGVIMAGVVMTMIPPLVVFFVMQESFMKGFALASEK